MNRRNLEARIDRLFQRLPPQGRARPDRKWLLAIDRLLVAVWLESQEALDAFTAKPAKFWSVVGREMALKANRPDEDAIMWAERLAARETPNLADECLSQLFRELCRELFGKQT